MTPQRPAQPYAMPQQPKQMNPMQQMGLFMQAMQNPVAFVRQRFPDIPDNMNDPGQILQYLQRTRNISDEQLNQTASRMQGQLQGR